jgi:hypothetical protein
MAAGPRRRRHHHRHRRHLDIRGYGEDQFYKVRQFEQLAVDWLSRGSFPAPSLKQRCVQYLGWREPQSLNYVADEL